MSHVPWVVLSVHLDKNVVSKLTQEFSIQLTNEQLILLFLELSWVVNIF